MTTERFTWARWLAPKKIGAVYVLIALIIVFSLISPSTFPTYSTLKLVLNQYAVTAVIGLALVLPLATGLFDLSIGSAAGLSGIIAAWSLAHISPSPVIGVLAGIVAAVAAGLANSLVVLTLGIDSFIGTLATGSIFAALTTAISGDNTISTNVNGAFQNDIALTNIGGITLPVIVALVAALVIYIVMEKAALGRKAYAIGFDVETARLGGVRVVGIRALALVVSAGLAGIGGILATAQIGAGDPATGPSFLLPGFAAAFLGATQFRPGRVNAWGTVVAVILLGVGSVGLITAGAAEWTPDVYTGVVLIAAVGLTSNRLAIWRDLRRRSRHASPTPVASSTTPPAASA